MCLYKRLPGCDEWPHCEPFYCFKLFKSLRPFCSLSTLVCDTGWFFWSYEGGGSGGGGNGGSSSGVGAPGTSAPGSLVAALAITATGATAGRFLSLSGTLWSVFSGCPFNCSEGLSLMSLLILPQGLNKNTFCSWGSFDVFCWYKQIN